MKTKANDSIFITQDIHHNGAILRGSPSLTKREHFAAMAMQGILAKKYDEENICHSENLTDTVQGAVEYADALIEELNK